MICSAVDIISARFPVSLFWNWNMEWKQKALLSLIMCHTGTAPVGTRYLGYSWRYAVGMQRYPYSGLLDAITEWNIYNSRYVSTYRIQNVYIRSEESLLEGRHQASKTIEKY